MGVGYFRLHLITGGRRRSRLNLVEEGSVPCPHEDSSFWKEETYLWARGYATAGLSYARQQSDPHKIYCSLLGHDKRFS